MIKITTTFSSLPHEKSVTDIKCINLENNPKETEITWITRSVEEKNSIKVSTMEFSIDNYDMNKIEIEAFVQEHEASINNKVPGLADQVVDLLKNQGYYSN